MIEAGALDVSYNDILEKLDDIIYREVARKRNTYFSLFSTSSLLGKSLYMFQRVTSTNNKINNYYSEIACKECLILLTTEICELLSIVNQNQSAILAKRSAYYMEIGQSFIFLYLCLKSKINKDFVQNYLQRLRIVIESMLDPNIIINIENVHYIFYLLYSYSFIAFDMKESQMMNHCKSWCTNLIPKIQPYLEDKIDKKFRFKPS